MASQSTHGVHPLYVPALLASSRTFRCRCQSPGDAELLRAMVGWASERCELQRLAPGLDVTMQFTIREGLLYLAEIQWLFSMVDDDHVALESLAVWNRYDGERRPVDDADLAAVALSEEKRRNCAESLARLMDYYEEQIARFDNIGCALMADPR